MCWGGGRGGQLSDKCTPRTPPFFLGGGKQFFSSWLNPLSLFFFFFLKKPQTTNQQKTPNPAEQFVEKSSCAQALSDLSSLDPHGDFSTSPSSLCTEPLIPTTPIIPSEEMAKISCSLETKELWDKFHELGTEMIITKSGR